MYKLSFFLFVLMMQHHLVRTEDQKSSTIAQSTISSSTSSPSSIVSSTAPSTTQSPESKENQTDLQQETFKNVAKYCGCDMTGNLCDLNCCCDADCDAASKKLFSKCLDEASRYSLLDAKYCYNQNIIYKNNTNYILERMTNVGGLFCIYKDNTKQEDYLMDKKIVSKLDDLEAFNLRAEFNWTSSSSKVNYDLASPEQVDPAQLGGQYKAEKPIYTLNIKKIDSSNQQIKSLSKLSFPVSVVIRNGECTSKRKVDYLKDFNSYCFRWIRNLQTDCKAGSVFDVNNYYLILIRNGGQLFEASNELPSLENLTLFCGQDNCVPTKSEQEVKAIGYQNEICYNMVRSVSYQIVHNERIGIKRILVNFEYEDIKQPTDKRPLKFFQKFTLKFVHENLFNSSINISHYSGNLGYELEKPLIGQYEVDGELVASPFKSVNLQRDDDECRFENVNEHTVLFGLNHRSGCLFYVNKNLFGLISDAESSRQTMSAEIFCAQFNEPILGAFQQKKIASLLSAYGKYNISMTNSWTPLLKQPKTPTANAALAIENQINGFKTTCQLIKQVNYRFTYAMVADSREPQRKLVSAVQSKVFHTFDLCLNPIICTNRAIELSSSIQFVQMKREKRMRVADSPAFKFELPEDFFYPFV